jgi:hypothetical protein
MKAYFDKNPESIPYLDRLVREWEQHGKIIIACDFDDTIRHWGSEGFNPKRVLEVLKVAKETGAYIVIFTASDPERYTEIEHYCQDLGLEIDTINKNPINLPYGNSGKVYANIFIDDRAGLNEALNILEFATYKIRGHRHGSNLFDL